MSLSCGSMSSWLPSKFSGATRVEKSGQSGNCDILKEKNEREYEFIQKLEFCETRFDFSNGHSHLVLKEKKRKYLVEILEEVCKEDGVLNRNTYGACIRMICGNIFRSLPLSKMNFPLFETDEGDDYQDACWPHLQLVYEVLRKFISCEVIKSSECRSWLNMGFITQLINLFSSEDCRERRYLKTILHCLYGNFIEVRGYVRTGMTHFFHRVIYQQESHCGVAELLEILGSIVNGFVVPLKEEYKEFLRRELLPLHLPVGLPGYHIQLSFCIAQLVEKEPKMGNEIVEYLLKHWPSRSTRKEVMFLDEVEEILILSDNECIGQVMGSMFRRILKCAESAHFQVAERALYFWNNDEMITLIARHREQIMRNAVCSLQRNIETHWNDNVLCLSENVQTMLQDMDPELYQSCMKALDQQQATF